MTIAARVQFNTFSSDRVVFVKTDGNSKPCHMEPKHGIKIANFFEELFGYATKIKIGNQEYSVNKRSLAKFLAKVSKGDPSLVCNKKVKDAVFRSFQDVAHTSQAISLPSSDFRARQGTLIIKHLERSINDGQLQPPSSESMFSCDYWTRLFDDDLKHMETVRRDERIDQLQPEKLAPHYRLVQAHRHLKDTLGEIFQIASRGIEPRQLSSFDPDLLIDMYVKLEMLNEALKKESGLVSKLKAKRKLLQEIERLERVIESLDVQQQQYQESYRGYLEIKMILDQNKDIFSQKPNELKMIPQELIHKISNKRIQFDLVRYNQAILEYQTLRIDLPPKEASLSDEIRQKLAEIANLRGKKEELEKMLGVNDRTTFSFHEEEMQSLDKKSLRTLVSLEDVLKDSIRRLDLDLKELEDDPELGLLQYQLHEIEQKKAVIANKKILGKFKEFGARARNFAARKGIGGHVDKPKTLDEHIQQLERAKADHLEYVSRPEATDRDREDLDRVTQTLHQYKRAKADPGKQEVLAEIEGEIKEVKDQILKRKEQLAQRKVELDKHKQDLKQKQKEVKASLSLKFAQYNLRAAEIAKELGFEVIRHNGQVDLSAQFSEKIKDLQRKVYDLEKSKSEITNQLKQLVTKSTTLVSHFPDDFEREKPSFDLEQKGKVLQLRDEKKKELLELSSQTAKVQSEEQVIKHYFQAKAAAIYNLCYIQYLISDRNLISFKQKVEAALKALNHELNLFEFRQTLNDEWILPQAIKAMKDTRFPAPVGTGDLTETSFGAPSEVQASPPMTRSSLYASGAIHEAEVINPIFLRLHDDLSLPAGGTPTREQNSQLRLLVALDSHDLRDDEATNILLREKTVPLISVLLDYVLQVKIEALTADLQKGFVKDPSSKLDEDSQAKLAIYQLFYKHAKDKKHLRDYLRSFGVLEDYFTSA